MSRRIAGCMKITVNADVCSQRKKLKPTPVNEESDDEEGKSEDYDDEGEESDASVSNLQFYEAMYNDAVERHKLSPPDCF